MGSVPAASRICIADGMRAEHANPKAFMAELVEAANAEWRRVGVGGVTLIFAEYEAGKALLDTGPGDRPLTVALVRAPRNQGEALTMTRRQHETTEAYHERLAAIAVGRVAPDFSISDTTAAGILQRLSCSSVARDRQECRPARDGTPSK